jgi:arylsulfatase A-like enzyme
MNCIVVVCDTLRRDHCGPYHQGRPLCDVQSDEQPDWVVPTPNMDRLAERGTTFDNAWHGSTPCMPARRDVYTGRYEFLERGWGPLETDDADLPRQVSGEPNTSVQKVLDDGYSVSELVTDHFHLWEQGSGNYHMGYTGFEFVRGQEADAWKTDPIDFECPDGPHAKQERHFRNRELTWEDPATDNFAAQVFTEAADWIDHNHAHDDFYLHIDCFDPHEPWDPPEEILTDFDERGYDVEWQSHAAYAEYDGIYTEDEVRHFQARYAAMVVNLDRWLGELLDALDRHSLWEDTMVVLTTDHGTFNGDRGRMGKNHTQFDPLSHIPFVVAHPGGAGERRDQLVQLVDIYPTVLEAVGRQCPPDRHGVALQDVLADPDAATREYAICGEFGEAVTITDGEWVLHQAPEEGNEPLYWYGVQDSRFFNDDLGPVENGRRDVLDSEYTWGTPTWLSDKRSDPNERENLADERPEKRRELQVALRERLLELDAPDEQLDRLGLRSVEV